MNRTISHYELLSRIGAGGMGEVYRARDMRLGRIVALKFLPEAFAQDRERLARFEREAQLLASLNHPNIASLHGFEEAEGKPFLVMELAEGESLADRMQRGRMSLKDSLAVALQIAQALEEAHDRGVVHRDLKPGNVHVTEDGKVKVLDFGLAKALESEPEAGGARSQSPTITQATATGMILGTAAYMSPEQAKGKAADRRSDIWSFGVVLLEMITGRPVFDGETVTETLAAIMKDSVPLDRLPADCSVGLRGLLARCLERDPKLRLQAVGEARIALETLRQAAPASRPAPSKRWSTLLPWAVAALGLVVAGVALLERAQPDATPSKLPVRKFTIATGPLESTGRRPVVLSPDGRRIAQVHGSGIRIRDLGSLEARALVETPGLSPAEVPTNPAWSPDSRTIAYLASGRLWKVAADGGTPTAVCTIGEGVAGIAWLSDDRIVYAVARGDMFVVSARGGDPAVFLARDPDNDVDFHDPWPLPGGRGVIYALHREAGVDTIELFADGERKQLLRLPRTETDEVQVVNAVTYSPSGHLVYLREQGNRGIWAVPFSLASLEVTGDPFLVAAYARDASVSADGTLLYIPGRADTPLRVVWVSPRGDVEGTVVEPALGVTSPALSADGARVAYAADEGGAGEIWVHDLASGTRTRLTFTPDDESWPVWIPGQNRVAFMVTDKEGLSTVSARAADGSGAVTVLVEDAERPTFSADGKWMIFQRTSDTKAGILRMPLDGSAQPEMVLPGTRSNLYYPMLSPDGRYLSYLSWERGAPSTYLRPFPTGEGKWELPGSWESSVVWLEDRILYFTARPEPAVMEIPVNLAGTLSLGTPRKLFDLRPNRLARYSSFAVSPDGKRLLMVQDTGDAWKEEELVVVENWAAEFERSSE